jgi:hypothetical protein
VAVSETCSSKQAGTVLQQAVVAFQTINLTQQHQLVSKIKSLPNYQQDPNCMYVVTMYYANLFDYKDAESSLELFDRAYTGQKLNPNLTKFASVVTLRSTVANINTVLQQDSQNATPLVSEPPAKK